MKLEANEISYFSMSMQQALIGKVPSELRAVSYEVFKKEVWIKCIFDGDISRDNRKLMESFKDSFDAGLFEGYNSELSLVEESAPKECSHLKYLVYFRYEPQMKNGT